MKIYSCLLMFFLLCNLAKGQSSDASEMRRNHTFKVEPFKFVAYKANLGYEQIIDRYGLGVSLNLYHDIFENSDYGYKAGAYARLYFPSKQWSRFFVQGKLLGGAFRQEIMNNYTEIYFNYDGSYAYSNSFKDSRIQYFFTYGGSFAIGYQLLTKGRVGFLFEPKLEFQMFPDKGKASSYNFYKEYHMDSAGNIINEVEYSDIEDDSDYGFWYLIGPGAIIYPSIKYGIIF